MPKKIKIMIIEDNPEYRHVINFALEDDPAIELIAQFGTAEMALRSIENKTNSQTPDLILLDLNLPRMSGLEALPWFQKYAPEIKVIILTQSDKEADIFCAIKNGASGYLLKSAGIEEITGAIRSVAKHIRHIYEKLQVENAPAAITKAYKSGIFPLDN